MNLVNVSHDALVNLVERKVKEGLIKEAEIESLLDIPSRDMAEEVDIFHTYFCKAEHAEGACEYYLELKGLTSYEEVWRQPAHKQWLLNTNEIKDKHKLEGLVGLELVKRVCSIKEHIKTSDRLTVLALEILSSLISEDIIDLEAAPSESHNPVLDL